MGSIRTASGLRFTIEDRALAHLHRVLTQKLLRRDAVLLVLGPEHSGSPGRVAVWLHPSQPLEIVYSGNQPAELNPVWLEALTALTNSARGLTLLPEAQAEAAVAELRAPRNAP